MVYWETLSRVKGELKKFAERPMAEKDGHVLMLVSDDERIPTWQCISGGKSCDWQAKVWPNRHLRIPRYVKRSWMRHLGMTMPDLSNVESFEAVVQSGRSNRRWRFAVTYEPERFPYSRSYPWVLTRRQIGSDTEAVISVYQSRLKAYVGLIGAVESQAIDTLGDVVDMTMLLEPDRLATMMVGAIRDLSTEDATRRLKYLVDLKDAADGAIKLVSAVLDTLNEEG